MRCGRGNPRTCRVSQTAALLFDLVAQEHRLETESAVPASTTPRSSGFRGHRSQHTDIVEHHLIPVPGESENYFSLAERSRAHLAQHESLASAKDGQESPCRYPSGDAVQPLRPWLRYSSSGSNACSRRKSASLTFARPRSATKL